MSARFWNFVSNLGQSSSKKQSPSEMRFKCLEIHLETYKSSLQSGEFHRSFEIGKAVDGFEELFECCSSQYHCEDRNSPKCWFLANVKNVSSLWINNCN